MRTTNPAKAKSIEVTEKVIFPDATEQTTKAAFEEIGDTILGAPAASIEFASIPAGYAFFLLIWHDIYGDNAALQELRLTFNSDGGNNYDEFIGSWGGAVTTVHAHAYIPLGACGFTGTDELHSNGKVSIFNRASQEKLVVGDEMRVKKAGANVEDVLGQHIVSKWRNVADEIDTITITPSIGNFVAGSRVILLGVKT